MSVKDVVSESHRMVRIAPRGLGQRVALAAVNMTQRFKSDILLCTDSLCIDGKSALMAFMMLGALKGQLLEVTARGVDSKLAVDSLMKLFRLA